MHLDDATPASRPPGATSAPGTPCAPCASGPDAPANAPSLPSGRYVGRFAPSPSGPLHRGSIVAALASWLDARAHDGRWILRIEDIDPPRQRAGALDAILAQLHALGLTHDGEVQYQSAHVDRFEHALDRLRGMGRVYPCGCTRREIAIAASKAGIDGAAGGGGGPGGGATGAPADPLTADPLTADPLTYTGRCRDGLPAGRSARAWRFRLDDESVAFDDRALGQQRQHPLRHGGDFVLRRADGLWAYQLAVVVDDAASGITDVVRGADLLGSTGRQIMLQRALGLPTPRYLHLPLVVDSQGRKLSKSEDARPVALDAPAETLARAAQVLGLRTDGLPVDSAERWLDAAIVRWRDQFGLGASAVGTLPPNSTASFA
ncbi:MAG: tRNA glutamyl-Q(34) synthetase GluQRS [Lautropia sp.]